MAKKKWIPEQHEDEMGRCPMCGEQNLQYGASEPEDDMMYYPWTCLECGTVGKEWYAMNFIEHTTDED